MAKGGGRAGFFITSREWIDSVVVLRLTGLPFEEAEKMIHEEAAVRHLAIHEEHLQQLFRRTNHAQKARAERI